MNRSRVRYTVLLLWAAVLTAPLAAEDFVVMTYNIRSAAGNGNFSIFGRELPHLVTQPRSGPNQIAAVSRAVGADLLGLQEVQGRSMRSVGVDQPKRVASKLGMHHTFGTTRSGMSALADRTGNAVLSLGEQRDTHRLDFGNGRQATFAVVEQAGFPRGLLFAATHLSTGSDSARRRGQLEKLFSVLAKYDLPTVLVGDFNAKPDSEEIRALVAGDFGRPFVDAFAAKGEGEGLTAPALSPRHRIDYIFVSPEIEVLKAKVIEGAAPLSDHLPVAARLRPMRVVSAPTAGLFALGSGSGVFGVGVVP